MRTNLIQSYLQNNTQAVQQYRADNVKKNFDVNKELSNRTFIKPLPSNGHLVRNSLFDLPSEIFRDIKYDAKAFHHSVKGKANDNELGRLNDLGMKLGGLTIATYLFSKKFAPLSKAMEFVGLVSFFAAMDIWPKLALQIPAYLIHGFDVRQQYRDNYGTKKPVFQDHQFIPWDLYSDEEINKIGDRLRVPKDMKNRRDFIQEKMRKIALQNNTMWMLTAGFATPVMSALICEALKDPIHNYQDGKLNKKANALLSNFNTEIGKYDFSAKNKKLDALIEKYKGQTITEEAFSEISKTISAGMDTITAKAVERDLKNVILQKGYNISKKTFENLSESLKEVLKGIPENDINELVPSADEIISKLDDSKRSAIFAGETLNGQSEFSHYVTAFENAIDEKFASFEASHPGNSNIEGARFRVDEMIQSEKSILDTHFKAVPSTVLTEEAVNNLKEVNKVLNTFHARQRVLNKYAYLKTAQSQETYLANTWNGILDNDMLKTLGITEKDISKTRMDSNLVGNLLRDKLETIVSDDAKYNEVIDKIIEKLNFLENRTKFAQYEKYNPNEKNPYKDYVDTTFNEASAQLKQNKMKYTAQRLNGYDVGSVDSHTLKDLQLSFVQDRVRGVKSSFYRLLNTLDFFKRVSDKQHLDSLYEYNYTDAAGNLIKHVDFTRSVKEEMIEMSKQLLIGGHSSDYAVKFFFLRDPELNPDNLSDEQRKILFSDIKTEMGKVVNEFYGKKALDQLADNPHDRVFYDSAMRLMYSDRLSPKTKGKIENSLFFKNFEQYRKELFSYLGGDEYFTKKNHKVVGGNPDSTSEFRFQLLGSSLDDMFTKLFNQKYNSKTWLKIFGGLGAVLFGVTVLSQFFMGKMPKDKIVKENK